MKSFVLDDFGSGLWIVDAEDILLPPDALLVAKNIEYFTDGEGRVKIRGRRGKLRKNTDGVLSDAIHTIHHHPPFNILVGYGGGFEHSTGVNLDPVPGAPTSIGNDPWQFVHNATLNASYGVSGDDGLWKYDGVNMSEVPLTGGIFAATSADIGPYLAEGQQRLWATKGDSLNELVYVSDVDTDDVWRIPPISVNDRKGGNIMGIVAWRDAMLFAKSTGWWRFFGDPEFGFEVHPYSERGVIAPYTIDPSPYGVFFLAHDGLFITDGADISGINMSSALRPLFITPSNQFGYSNARGRWMPRKEQYWLKLSALEGDDLYVLQRLDTKNGPRWVWSYWTNMSASALGLLGESPSLGDVNGKWWEGDVGSIDNDNDTLTPIPIEVQSAFVPFDVTLPYGRIVRMHTVFRSQQTVLLRIYYDASAAIASQVSVGLAYPTPRLQSVDVPITNQAQHGQWVSVGAVLPSASYEIELYRFAPDVALRGPALRRKGLGTQL